MLDLDSIFDPDRAVQTRALNLSQSRKVLPSDLTADWRELWEERAAIREYDGGYPRDVAESLALAEILDLQLNGG